jgi:hypothetical protein
MELSIIVVILTVNDAESCYDKFHYVECNGSIIFNSCLAGIGWSVDWMCNFILFRYVDSPCINFC